jgi:hypothetical protein
MECNAAAAHIVGEGQPERDQLTLSWGELEKIVGGADFEAGSFEAFLFVGFHGMDW